MDTEHQKMEISQPLENKVEQEEKTLKITNEITNHLDGAGKWGKFLAIMGFVFMGLMLVMGIIMSIALSFILSQEDGILPFPRRLTRCHVEIGIPLALLNDII